MLGLTVMGVSGMTLAMTTVAAADRPKPRAIPSTPPREEVVAASMTNWRMMAPSRAPSALRMPISLVRSVTDTSMMFMMPMPPTTREMAAMPARM
ncbi:Uncharacterised protein [uncultured Oscillibacter sp.]|nr:Uncharacterised protein [uncultured Oscillibacter sp.]